MREGKKGKKEGTSQVRLAWRLETRPPCAMSSRSTRRARSGHVRLGRVSILDSVCLSFAPRTDTEWLWGGMGCEEQFNKILPQWGLNERVDSQQHHDHEFRRQRRRRRPVIGNDD